MTRETVALLLLGVGTVAIAFVIGGNLFEQVICMPGWRTAEGVRAWRMLTSQRNAGYFFLPLALTSLACLVAATALGWNQPAARNPFALGATVAVLLAMVLTGTYLVPRAAQIFGDPPPGSADATRLLGQFIAVNYVRVLLACTGLVSALLALRR